eukprot:1158098-Pelagomonas_calceolata.AAC.9
MHADINAEAKQKQRCATKLNQYQSKTHINGKQSTPAGSLLMHLENSATRWWRGALARYDDPYCSCKEQRNFTLAGQVGNVLAHNMALLVVFGCKRQMDLCPLHP